MVNDPWHSLNSLLALAREASEGILDIYYRSRQFDVIAKEDASPLTQADLVAHEKIAAGLAKLTPDIPLLSEEQANIAFAQRQQWDLYWLVDPLDGTKEFIRHSGDFAINIALIKNHVPIFGLIYAPVLEQAFFAVQGQGAFKQVGNDEFKKIHARAIDKKIIITVGHHYKIEKLKTMLAGIEDYEVLTLGSSLKFCAIADGRADVYPRLGKTSEWDTAAGQIIVEEAGGCVVDFSFQPLRYNLKDSLINPPFLALSDRRVLEKFKM